MVDFFDENGDVFIKLHKPSGDNVLYWETWSIDAKTAVTHWGKLGNNGDQKEVKAGNNKDLRASINNRINKLIAEGYQDIPYENYHLMILTFEMESIGEAEDLERKEDLRNMITAILGWTGNGNCDEAEVREDKTILYADVLKPDFALQSLKAAFKEEELTGEFFVTIMKDDKILKENKKVVLK